MIGHNPEKEFSLDNYEQFYEHHQFKPIDEKDFRDIHELIPRFGWAFDKIEELGAKTLLDLGCLDGSFALSIAHHLGLQVTGVDLTKDGVDLASDRAHRYGLDGVFVQGFVEDWLERFIKEGKKFDVVTFFEIIEHVEDPQRCLKLIDQVLAPGGSVLVSTPAFESPTFGKDDEKNKCHIRLYTMEDEDYEEANKYGHVRKATSITKEIGKDRIKEMGVYSELINVWYQ
jgi:2-polyprenyl-3-methyl-5-hydroxy-6-metoxy-1,4-benzoquinol methylase